MDEKTILHQILEADRKGREACEKARRDRADYDRRRPELCRETEAVAAAAARREVEQARSEALARSETELTKLREDYETRLAALQARYEAGVEGWTERLFRTVVGLDD